MTSSQSDFITWLQSLDLTDLSNEAEVESKFVIPLFQKLGFPDSVRRDKHPLITYRPGRRGRKPEIDLIYFSVSEPSEQTSSTSLVIVEAKEPGKRELAEDIAQAKFYSYYLKAPFLVITNGRQLKVLQQYSYHEEMVFDGLVDMLKDEVVAGQLFDRLQYETVKAIKHGSPLLPATFVFENYLPPAPKHFCGRVEELSMLQNAVQSNTITIVGGIAGIGKTYLTAELTQSLSCSPLWLSFEPKTHVDQFVTTIAGYVEEIFDDKEVIVNFACSTLG